MITLSLIASLSLGLQVPAGPEQLNFTRCLRNQVNGHLERRTDPTAFQAVLAGACNQEAAAYRSAYIAAAIRAGAPRAVAEADAAVQIEDLRSNFTEAYRDSL